MNYWKLITEIDDLLEILSFKFGLRIPTRRYSILLISEQYSDDSRGVWSENKQIIRNWKLDDAYIECLNEGLDIFIRTNSHLISKVTVFKDWSFDIFSSSHHSGTARMSISPENGVCNGDGRVHAFKNLFVCDASAIPSSGYANTGLTIVALAMRLADHLKRISNK
jgi:choline dehydrogenase-like flavoprotein